MEVEGCESESCSEVGEEEDTVLLFATPIPSRLQCQPKNASACNWACCVAQGNVGGLHWCSFRLLSVCSVFFPLGDWDSGSERERETGRVKRRTHASWQVVWWWVWRETLPCARQGFLSSGAGRRREEDCCVYAGWDAIEVCNLRLSKIVSVKSRSISGLNAPLLSSFP